MLVQQVLKAVERLPLPPRRLYAAYTMNYSLPVYFDTTTKPAELGVQQRYLAVVRD